MHLCDIFHYHYTHKRIQNIFTGVGEGVKYVSTIQFNTDKQRGSVLKSCFWPHISVKMNFDNLM